MKTRSIIIEITGTNDDELDKYAEILADLADEAMIGQEAGKEIPPGIKYEGVAVIDPDAPEEVLDAKAEIMEPENT